MNGLQESQKLESALNVNQPIGIKRKRSDVPYGYCHCGCGQKTNLAQKTKSSLGIQKGEPLYYIKNHLMKNLPLKDKGYRFLHMPDHPKSSPSGKVLAHVLVAEKILNKPIPDGVIIHHYGKTSENNKIVICENQAYHMLLHRRARALNACGHADWIKCSFCKQYDKPENLILKKYSRYHLNCRRKYSLERYYEKKKP